MQTKVYPKTNISKAYYRHLIRQIQRDPLVRHTTLAAACLMAAASVLAGMLIWYAKSNPGNLIQTTGTVANVTTGKTDSYGGTTTFVTFEFLSCTEETSASCKKSVRQPAIHGIHYENGQKIKIGYHPKNTNYARLLNDSRPPAAAVTLWIAPFVVVLWFVFVALFRHHKRQLLIWDAADAADAND